MLIAHVCVFNVEIRRDRERGLSVLEQSLSVDLLKTFLNDKRVQ